jgi:DNA replication protein DnaC
LSGAGNTLEWQCKECGGDGFVLDASGEAVACACRERRIHMARMRGVSSVIPRKYRGVSFERAPVPQLDPEAVRAVRKFVLRIEEHLSAGRGIWLEGDVGTGKTTLAMLVSKAALDKNCSVAIYSVPRLLARIRVTYGADTGGLSYMDLFDRLVTVDLLHLEDVGAERPTDWVLEQLYSLINERYEQQRSVMITTNVSLDDLEQQLGPRTVSRLVEMCDPIRLYGPDRRYQYDPARSALG